MRVLLICYMVSCPQMYLNNAGEGDPNPGKEETESDISHGVDCGYENTPFLKHCVMSHGT